MIQAIDLFSGVGGVTSALQKAGLRSLSVEKDPRNIGLSTLFRSAHKINFPENQFSLSTVQEFVSHKSDQVGEGIEIIHGSPPCGHYTAGTRGMGESRPVEDSGDIEAAIAFNALVRKVKPKYFTLEQVPEYVNSSAYSQFRGGLEDHYDISEQKVRMTDYGIPQSRVRLFTFGWLKGLKPLELPPKSPHKGWYSTLQWTLPKEAKYPAKAAEWTIREPLLLLPNKGVDFYNCKIQEEPYPTILRSHFVDQRGNYRSTSFKFVKQGKCYLVPLRAIASGQGFFDDFIFPPLEVVAGQGIGNAFCPRFYYQFLRHNGVMGNV